MKKDTYQKRHGQALISVFNQIKDPRVKGRCLHKLIDIIVIAVCGILCGAEHWNEIEEFGVQRIRWLKRFLELPNGIPSHQTFCRVFALIPPNEFLSCFIEWSTTTTSFSKNDVVAIDGKTLRNSHHHKKLRKPLHLINAYACSQGITIGSIKTPDKSNEIKGIPPLLKSLNIAGLVITMDAMGTQKGIANLIISKKANYVLALKENHRGFYKKVQSLFAKANTLSYQSMVYKENKTTDYDRSRYEKRQYTLLPMMYLHSQKQFWPGLQTFIQVKSLRYVNDEEQTSTRYYISSLPMNAFQLIAKAIREHWHVENRLHWKLDVAMHEDACRIYHPHAAENFSTLRKLVLQFLEKDKTTTHGIALKRYKAALSTTYLKKVIGF